MSRWRWTIVGVSAAILVAAAFWPFSKIAWIGSTDLEIEFRVADASTSRPIANAIVEITSRSESQTPLHKDDPGTLFELTTDVGGIAKTVRHCTSAGSTSIFHDEFTAIVPEWSFRAKAVGYRSGEWKGFEPKYRAVRTQMGSRLIVLLTLERNGVD